MSGLVLVLNSGSSSIRFQLVDPVAGTAVASGLAEQIGEPDGRVVHDFGDRRFEHRGPIADHAQGMQLVGQMFKECGPDLGAPGSGRSVTGWCTAASCFASRHFSALLDAAATYAIDQAVADAFDVRRRGFHGTSHQYVSGEAGRLLRRELSESNTSVLHLGNGASASAVRGGVAVETSMGPHWKVW